jgi:hypothetical protein
MHSTELTELIRRNERELQRLHKRIHESVKHRDESEEKRLEWSLACEEFHTRIDSLAFPGGFSGVYERITAGDPTTIDAALSFLEIRPFFFRSGYMWKDILRKCKRAPMSVEQAERFATILAKYRHWRQNRDLSSRRGAAVRRDLLPLLLRFHGLFPIELPDWHLDGLVTVGDLYILLCNGLKLEPNSQPETQNGVVRPPLRKLFPASPEYWGVYKAWREFAWTPEDVWATLVSTIIDVCKLDPLTAIDSQTVLREPSGHLIPL